MKNIIAFLLIFHWAGAAQSISIPSAPKKVEFADVEVILTPQAQVLVDAEIQFLLTPENDYLAKKMERIQWYFPLIEKILEEEDVPEDFKYIAVLESSLNPLAVSTSNAVGFWQFKSGTAAELGLKMTNDIDERKEIIASTRAAATYLKRNNMLYHNWVSTLLTYNLGAAGVGGKFPTEWAYANTITLDANADRYLIKAMAHRIAFEHRYNRTPNSDYQLVVYPTSKISLDEIAKELTLDVNDLKKYNTWLNGSTIPSDKTYYVMIPARTQDAPAIETKIKNRKALEKIDLGFPELKRTTPENAAIDEPIYYEINGRRGILAQDGDNTAKLAKKAKAGMYKFLRYNDMTERDVIEAGKVYYLQAKNKKAKVPYHTMAEGQTLYDVSYMYGIRLNRLLIYNRLKSVQRLQPGRVVWLQKKRPKKQPIEIVEEAKPIEKDKPKEDVAKNGTNTGKVIDRTAPNDTKTTTETGKNGEVIEIKDDKELDELFKEGESTSTPQRNTNPATAVSGIHIVQPTETLFGIARKYAVSVDDIRRWNNMSDTDVLQTGQRLAINPKNAATPINPPAITTNTPTKPAPTTPSKPTTPPATSSVPSSTASAGYHTVQPGETLYRISVNYGVSVDDLKRWNNLADNTISVGQRIITSRPSNYAPTKSNPSTSTNATTVTHVVKPGETLYRISVNYGVSVDQLKALNNLKDNTISVGQSIRIK